MCRVENLAIPAVPMESSDSHAPMGAQAEKGRATLIIGPEERVQTNADPEAQPTEGRSFCQMLGKTSGKPFLL